MYAHTVLHIQSTVLCLSVKKSPKFSEFCVQSLLHKCAERWLQDLTSTHWVKTACRCQQACKQDCGQDFKNTKAFQMKLPQLHRQSLSSKSNCVVRWVQKHINSWTLTEGHGPEQDVVYTATFNILCFFIFMMSCHPSTAELNCFELFGCFWG